MQGMIQNLQPFILMLLIIVVFYFILIRPQKKKEKALKDMIGSLRVGDEVASIGGIHGKITRIKEDLFILETGVGTSKSYISIERAAISRLVKEGKQSSSDDDDFAPLPESSDSNENSSDSSNSEN